MKDPKSELMQIVGKNCLRLRDSTTKKNRHGHATTLSMADIAARAGISLATYDRIEKAKTDTTLETIALLAKAFHVKPFELLK